MHYSNSLSQSTELLPLQTNTTTPNTVPTIKPIQKIRVTISGLSQEQRENLQTQFLSLPVIYDSDLTFNTQYLITNSVTSGKYQLFRLRDLHIVRPQWILDSVLTNNCKLLPTAKHLLKAFEGATLGFLGFAPEQY
jgi:BRCA1 C Terminus (BRCT) domain